MVPQDRINADTVPVRIPRGASLPFQAMLPDTAIGRLTADVPHVHHSPKAPVESMAFRRAPLKRSK